MFDSFHALADNVTKRYTAQIKEVEHYIKNNSIEKLLQKPGNKKWCYLECIDHLNKTNENYFGQIKWNLDRDVENRLADELPFKVSFVGKFFINKMKPTEKQEIKWKSRTFGFIKPENHLKLEKDKVLELFIERIDFGLEQLRRIKGNQYNSLKINSLAGPFIKFSLGEAYLIAAGHNERHLLQGKYAIEKK